MKTLVIHNTLWAHYKSVLFEEIQKQTPPPHEFHVLQIARSEISRKGMEESQIRYRYSYTLLFDDYIEHVPALREIVAVLKFIYRYNPDVVNVTGYSSSASTLPAIFFARLLGKKVIMSSESTRKDKTRSFLKEAVKRLAVRLCSGFVVFGKSSEDYILDLGASPRKILVRKAAVVDNEALDREYQVALAHRPHPEIQTPHNYIYVGRMAPEKNIPLLVKAFRELKPDQWGLILVGNGPEDARIAELIRESPAPIYRYDAVSWSEVPGFFSRADCFVLPSRSEPWGLVINEAMVCGLPVVVSEACGCVPDLVNGNGFSVPPGDLSALRDAMAAIASHPDPEKMKRRSLEIIRDFSVRSVASAYVRALQTL
ncbi:MAG: glycosyltransferase family 4 protein [Leadbetterella sp.]|nr:glycosyltransferase family 4 protein [Leadbetterella sp.]